MKSFKDTVIGQHLLQPPTPMKELINPEPLTEDQARELMAKLTLPNTIKDKKKST